MSKSDERIIEANPGVTAYDLLSTFGLSQKGYGELMAKGDPQPKKVLTPQIVEKVNAIATNMLIPEKVVPMLHNIQPALSQPAINHGGDVIVLTKLTGKRSPMTKFAADRLVRKFPTTYAIL